ncbi:hypothetical protein EGW08_003619 [Elysia chlorotica]|uniref:Uncharacterized protein n=1 Tax=Elysia chlorotica TaxID=188477 RepID=A0A433U464_ELYCH|nr:hypothetical protein EGW08_003619 [Elysia chlorotica]
MDSYINVVTLLLMFIVLHELYCVCCIKTFEVAFNLAFHFPNFNGKIQLSYFMTMSSVGQNWVAELTKVHHLGLGVNNGLVQHLESIVQICFGPVGRPKNLQVKRPTTGSFHVVVSPYSSKLATHLALNYSSLSLIK